jgi:hypothetical protein
MTRPGRQLGVNGSAAREEHPDVGIELLVPGMLIMAGGREGKPLDYDQLERWTRVGYERGMRQRAGERSWIAAIRLLEGERAPRIPRGLSCLGDCSFERVRRIRLRTLSRRA